MTALRVLERGIGGWTASCVPRAFSSRRSRRYPPSDVVFYMPLIGSMLSGEGISLAGGAETQVLALAKELARHGLRVAIIVFGGAGTVIEQIEGVGIIPRSAYTKSKGVIGKVVETARICRSLWNAPSPVIVQRGACAPPGLIAIYARLARRRLVFATTSVMDFDYRQSEYGLRDRLLFRFGAMLAHTIVVQTEEQVDLCRVAFGRRPALIKSIAPAAREPRDVPEAFLWVGRLDFNKRPLEYIALARALPEARFWMIGVPAAGDRDSAPLTQAVYGLAKQVRNLELLAPRQHSDLLALMDRAVASVNTSEFEGMPNTLLEAWTRGVPALVLTHDPGGVVERYGLGGFANGSPTRLAQLARQQWLTRAERSELSQRCRTYIRDNHAPDLIASKWLRVVSPESLPIVEGAAWEPVGSS